MNSETTLQVELNGSKVHWEIKYCTVGQTYGFPVKSASHLYVSFIMIQVKTWRDVMQFVSLWMVPGSRVKHFIQASQNFIKSHGYSSFLYVLKKLWEVGLSVPSGVQDILAIRGDPLCEIPVGLHKVKLVIHSLINGECWFNSSRFNRTQFNTS